MTEEEIAAAAALAASLAAEADAEALNNPNANAERAAAELAAAKTAAEAAEIREAEAKKKLLPTDDQATALKEIMKWKTKARDAEKLVELFEGIDPAKARAALSAQEAAERKELEARGEYDRILAQVNEQHTTELTGVQAERDRLKAALEEMTIAGHKKDIANAFANSPFVREHLTISGSKVQTLYGDHFEYVDGEFVGYDKPKGAAERTPLVDGQGKNLPFEAALEKVLKADPDYANMAKSTIRRGANSNSSGLDFEVPVVLNTSTDKINAGLKNLKRKGLNLRGDK
jgi:hypothetical protein